MARPGEQRAVVAADEAMTPLSRWLVAGLLTSLFLLPLAGSRITVVAMLGLLTFLWMLPTLVYREDAAAPAPSLRMILAAATYPVTVLLVVQGLDLLLRREGRTSGTFVVFLLVMAPVVWVPLRVTTPPIVVAWGRWKLRREPFVVSEPGPDHARLRPAVAELEAAGYAIDAFARGLSNIPMALLVHPDGSTALVARRLGGMAKPQLVVTLSTALVPGAEWLVTQWGPEARALPWALVDAVAGTPWAPPGARVLARHRLARSWLAAQGVRLPGVAPGGAVDDLRARVAAELSGPLPPPRILPRTERRTWTPADLPGIDARLDGLRRRQVAPAPRFPPMPSGPPTF